MPNWTDAESDTVLDTLCSVFVENNLFEASDTDALGRYDEEMLGLDQVKTSSNN